SRRGVGMCEHFGDAADVFLPVDAFQHAELTERVDHLEPVAEVFVREASGTQALYQLYAFGRTQACTVERAEFRFRPYINHRAPPGRSNFQTSRRLRYPSVLPRANYQTFADSVSDLGSNAKLRAADVSIHYWIERSARPFLAVKDASLEIRPG